MAKKPVGKTLAVLGIGTGLLVLIAWLWVHSAINRAWLGLERREAELDRELYDLSSARPVPRGEVVDGNAWDDYGPALADFGERQAVLKPLILPFLNDKPPVPPSEADRARLEAGLDALRPSMERVILGSRRGESRSSLDVRPWSVALDFTAEDWRAQGLGFALMLEARRRLRAGDTGRALDLLVAMLQFGRDLAGTADPMEGLIGLANLRNATEELWAAVDRQDLSAERLAELEPALETLELSFPGTDRWRQGEVLSFGRALLKGTPPHIRAGRPVDGEPASRPGWRHAWSDRAILADAFFRADRARRRLIGLDALRFAEARALNDGVMAELRRDGGYWGEALAGRLDVLGARHEYLARLRLLRLAVHHRRVGVWLELEDPCGTVLRHEERGGRWVLWSAGRDGLDDGGRAAYGKDVVLEMRITAR